ncbi:MAG: sigma-70 family RNA polymerase sigma factor, partial [Phycisphaerae bacterium]
PATPPLYVVAASVGTHATPPGQREVPMDASQKQYELNDYARTCIHHKARQLIGKAGYTEEDVEDIEQDLTLDLLDRLPRFDPTKSTRNTFVARCIDHKVSQLLRHRQTEMRDYQREACSLNDEVEVDEEELAERHSTISQDEHDLRIGKYTRPAGERADLQLDVVAVLADLPPELREVAEMLTTMPIAEVARKLGVPRSTLYETHLAQLRETFEAKGLGGYFS